MNVCFLFFLTEKINLLLVQQKTLTNQTFFFLILNWFCGAESKYSYFQIRNFVKISKSPDDIQTTLMTKNDCLGLEISGFWLLITFCGLLFYYLGYLMPRVWVIISILPGPFLYEFFETRFGH